MEFEENAWMRRATMLLMSLNNERRREFEKLVEEIGMSRSQHKMLMYLYRTNCSLSQTELARYFEISSAAIAVALRKLEKSGYIRRCSAISDSHYNEIALTEKGLEVVDKTHELFASTDVSLFRGLTDQDLEAFCRSIEHMRGNLAGIREGTCSRAKVKGVHVREIIAGVDRND